MKRKFRSNVLQLAALLAVSVFAFTGCGGGADTTENPVTTGPTAGPTYSGPAPATADIQAFRVAFWENVRGTNRCGNCHNAGGQMPNFARSDDVNAAYQQASTVVDRNSPSQSTLVLKVAGGHNCWLADASACASILTRWITDWVGASGTGGKQIELIAPTAKDPGSSKRFPANPPAEYTPIHDMLTLYCSKCHTSDSATAQSPYFAATDIKESYLAAIPKMNLDDPASSRFVIRLGRESHNCWSNCAANASALQAAIQAMADQIQPAQVSPDLITSKALTLLDGTVASGGNRYDSNAIALYEFKSGQGSIAYDTSGVDPAADLFLSGTRVTDFDWVGGWGIMFKTPIAKAQASTASSRKFQQLIGATGEFSIEAWVVPGNVTQEDARIVSYSGSTTARNFTLGQTLYNYDAFTRSTATGTNGTPALSTADNDKRLQASLQHVVVTFDPVNGRRIYVNGEFTGDLDKNGGGTLGEWDNSFAFVLGNEVSNNRPWAGVVRFVAVHNRALTQAQIKQNFQAGVGEKFFMLFGVEHIIGVPKSYVMFELSQYDSSGYLFANPKFISLDPNAKPGNIPLEGIRIGVNGAEPLVGQAYRLLKTELSDSLYSAATGQTLSTVGTIIALENGPESDEFFLCFDKLGTRSNVCSTYADTQKVDPAPVDRPSDIGVRTFDAINASMSLITGVDPNNAKVKATFTNVRQSLPATSDVQGFLSSHQTSIAQLALQYCSAMVDNPTTLAAFFPGVDFNTLSLPAQSASIVNPIVAKAVGTVGTQPAAADVQGVIGGLVTDLCNSSACSSTDRKLLVTKAACGAALGSATLLVQ
jgi:hypothetical protein